MLLLQPLHRLHRKVAGGDALVGKVPLADAYPLHDPLIRRVDHLFQVCVCQHTGWNVPGYTRNFCGDAASHITPREKCESQKPNVDCMRCRLEETSIDPYFYSAGRSSQRQEISAVFLSMAATEQYFSAVKSMARFTAASSTAPRKWKTTSSWVQTLGGSAARSPEQTTSSDCTFCLFFSRIVTMSVAVQAPSARSTISMGPGALFESRSESKGTEWPDVPVPRNFSSPSHLMDAVSMLTPLANRYSL